MAHKKTFVITLGYKKMVFDDIDTAVQFMNMVATATHLDREWVEATDCTPSRFRWKVVEDPELSANYEDLGGIL